MITINISDENWQILNKMKQPGETFDEVLTRTLNSMENKQ